MYRLYVLRPRVDLTFNGLKKALKNRFVDKNKETQIFNEALKLKKEKSVYEYNQAFNKLRLKAGMMLSQESSALGVWKRGLSKKYTDAVLIKRVQTIEEGL